MQRSGRFAAILGRQSTRFEPFVLRTVFHPDATNRQERVASARIAEKSPGLGHEREIRRTITGTQS
jgi:hypothetical protein